MPLSSDCISLITKCLGTPSASDWVALQKETPSCCDSSNWLPVQAPSAGSAFRTYWGWEETGCNSCSGWSPWWAALPERRAQAPYRGRASWDWGVWFQQPSCRGSDRNLEAGKRRQWDRSVGPSLRTKHREQRVPPPKPTFGFSWWSHVVLSDSSVTHKQLCPQWITQRSMNKTFGKQHAYLNKFQVRRSRRRFSGLTDDLTDIFAAGGPEKGKASFII